MKKYLSIIVLLMVSVTMFSQTEVVDKFEKITYNFAEFIQTPQRAVVTQSWVMSPTGTNSLILECYGYDVSYDVQKTESLVSPYIGYITAIIVTKDNKDCGDVIAKLSRKESFCFGHTTELRARENLESFGEPVASTATFTFVYQNETWILTSVEHLLASAFNLNYNTMFPVQDQKSVDFNSKWVALFE